MTRRDDELLQLAQSGLPPDELEAAVFRLLVARWEEKDADFGALLRASAIPRRLDKAVVGVLRGKPDDETSNRAALARLVDLSFFLADPEGRSYALHEDSRALLFEDWQAEGCRPRYVALSRALWQHFAEQEPLEALYHRFVFDPSGAFAEFEQRFGDAHEFYRWVTCSVLVLTVEAQARELNETQQRWLRYYRARLARLLDRWVEAEEIYQTLLANLPLFPVHHRSERPFPPTQDDFKLRTWTLHSLGMALEAQGKWEAALQAYLEALEGRQAMGDQWNEARTLNNIGNIYQLQRQWSKALETQQLSLHIQRKLGDRHGEAQTLDNIGNVYRLQGQWAEALNTYEQSLFIWRELGDKHGKGKTLMNMGCVWQAQGRWAEALEAYKQNLNICRELDDYHGERQTLMNIGNVYQAQGRWAEALDCYDQCLRISRDLSDYLGETTVLHNLGEWHQKQGQFEAAINHYHEALRLRQALAAWPQAGETWRAMAGVYAAQGEWPQAAETARRAAEAWGKIEQSAKTKEVANES